MWRLEIISFLIFLFIVEIIFIKLITIHQILCQNLKRLSHEITNIEHWNSDWKPVLSYKFLKSTKRPNDHIFQRNLFLWKYNLLDFSNYVSFHHIEVIQGQIHNNLHSVVCTCITYLSKMDECIDPNELFLTWNILHLFFFLFLLQHLNVKYTSSILFSFSIATYD